MTTDNVKTPRKSLETTKSIFLSLLVVLALLQTSELWLSNMSRNFFDVLFTQTTTSQPVGLPARSDYFVTPTQILTSAGGNRFFADHAPDPSAIVSLWPVLTQALAGGWSQITPLDASVFNQRSVIYVYPLAMSPQLFSQHFDLATTVFPSVLSHFEQIVFVPSHTAASTVYVYVIGTDTTDTPVTVRYTAITPLHSLLVSHVQQTLSHHNLDELYYLSSELLGLALERHAFLPRWRGAGFNEHPLWVERIMADATVSDIAERLAVFFPNPARVWRDRDASGAFRLGDYQRVVVFDNDRVQYTNHGGAGTLTQLSLLQNFDIAKAFLHQVNLLDTGTLRLTGYRQQLESTHFYFDLFVNNLPVYLHNSRDGYWATVTVTHGVVSEFNQVLLNLVIDDSLRVTVPEDLIVLLDHFGLDRVPRFGYSLDREADETRIFVRWILED